MHPKLDQDDDPGQHDHGKIPLNDAANVRDFFLVLRSEIDKHPWDLSPIDYLGCFFLKQQLIHMIQQYKINCFGFLGMEGRLAGWWFKCRAGTCTGSVGVLGCIYRVS